jgi:hypothetical protein
MDIRDLKTYIRNNITITIYNMNLFINLSKKDKYKLLEYSIKYNHNDIINLLIYNI